MKTILVLQRKGGSGKSTVASELFLSLKRSGIKSSFFDLDQQGGVILDQEENRGAVVQVVDTPGDMSANMARWIHEADVVVIPVLPSSVEIDSLMFMMDAYKANRKKRSKVVVVMNRATHYKSSRDFMEFLREELDSSVIITTLKQSESIVQAQAAGKSVVDFSPRSAAAKSAKECCNVIRSAAGLPSEE